MIVFVMAFVMAFDSLLSLPPCVGMNHLLHSCPCLPTLPVPEDLPMPIADLSALPDLAEGPLRVLFERSTTALIIVNTVGAIAAANDAAVHLLGQLWKHAANGPLTKLTDHWIGVEVNTILPAAAYEVTRLDWLQLTAPVYGEWPQRPLPSDNLTGAPLAWHVTPHFLPNHHLLELQLQLPPTQATTTAATTGNAAACEAVPPAGEDPLCAVCVQTTRRSFQALMLSTLDKLTEAAQVLAEQSRLQSAALEAAANAIVITDRQGVIQWCNPAFTRLTGYTFADAINHKPGELVKSGLNPPALYEQLWATILAGQVWSGELINRRKDGSTYTEEMAIAPVFDEQGTITHFVAIKQDISDRKQAEQALRQSQQQYEDLVNSLDSLVWEAEWQAGFRFSFISQTAERLLGYPVSVWLDNPHFWSQQLHPNDRDWVLEHYQQAVAAAEMRRESAGHACPLPPREIEYRMITADNRVIWLRDTVKVVREKGKPTKLRGVMIDITDRKQAELSLLSLQGQLQTLLASSPAIIYTLNPADWRQVLFISENLEPLLGYDPDRVLAEPDGFWQYIHPDDLPMLSTLLTAWLAGGAPTCMSHQCRFQTASGQWRWLHTQLTAIHDEMGAVIELVGSLTDVTSQVEADRRLEQISRNVPGMIYQYHLRTDGSSHFPYASEGIREIYGVTPEQVREDASLALAVLHPDDREQVQQTIAESAQYLTCWRCEYRVCLPNGQIRWLEGRATPQREPDGSTLWHGYITDITERKAIADQQSAILAAIPDLLLHLRRDGTCLECILPYGSQAKQFIPIQSHIAEVLPPDLLATQLQMIEQALATGELQIHEHQLLKRGELRYEEVRIAAINAEEVLVIMRDITARKQAERALQQQAERERLMTEIANRIRQSLDVYEVLNTTVSAVRQFLETDRVLIYRLYPSLNSPDLSGRVIAESVAAGWPSLLDQVLYDPCLQADTCLARYTEGYIHNFTDLETADLPTCYQHKLRQWQVRANLVIPILQGQPPETPSGVPLLWGFLIVHHCAVPRVWQVGEISLLRQLADQVAIALQQSELYAQVRALNTGLEQQVQERTAQLQQSLSFESLLKRITDKVRDSLDESQILSSVVQELAIELQVECCDTGIYNAEQTQSTIAYEFTRSLTSAQGKTFTFAEATHPDIYPVLLRGEICLFCDVVSPPLRPDQYQLAILACPIVDDQGVLGDLWLFRARDQIFSEPEIRLVQQVANQCAIALRQSRLYQAAQRQVTELERLNQLKDDFLSTVSHELRTPMTNIKMATQMLGLLLGIKSAVPDAELPSTVYLDRATRHRLYQYFRILDQECQREINLISDLLDLTRLDVGKITLTPTCLQLQTWLPTILEPFQVRTRQQQQHLLLHLDDSLPLIRTDIPGLERVVSELLNNACKYTPPGEVITVTAAPALSPPVPTAVVITVSNSGTEIPPTEYDRIFEKFYRIPNNDPWKHGGTGLGLALVKKLVERLHGTITVHSAHQQVTFRIALPLDWEQPGA
ncbi:PAS domain-containing protein [Trichothermofontia sichuanensis B231]|uniref:PAS domain-containing protein n=1 Tax=Trichothermofontia sichuanensis TaxID=3045816 RepID=UPI002247E234|nr:PAS domain-containing protein [Trichothermofontia sichuanensis]UZQ56061.1 PAS domain-containing protein [Trichothermofontia sichuanensis B231]